MFCINAFTAFESTFLSTYSFLYAGTLPIFLVGPLIDGDAAGWPFIHPSKWNSSSASPFLQSPSTSIQKCSRRGMVHSRNTFFLATNNTLRPACVYLRFIVMAHFLPSIIRNQSFCPPFMWRLWPCHSSHILLILTRTNSFAMQSTTRFAFSYDIVGREIKWKQHQSIESLFYSYSKVYTR